VCKRKYLFLLFLLLFAVIIHANNKAFPSQIEISINPNDNYRLAKQAFEKMLSTNNDSLPYLAETIFQNKTPKCIALGFYVLADYYHMKQDYVVSQENRIKSISIYENINNTDYDFLAKAYMGAGLNCEYLHSYKDALGFYDKAISIAHLNKDDELLSEALSNKSFAYYYLGDYAQSIQMLEQALEIQKKLKNPLSIAEYYNNLGFIYLSWEKYETAIEYYQKSLEYCIRLNLPDKIAIRYNNIGMAYFEKEEYSIAEGFIKKALEIELFLENKANAAKRYNNLGLIYFKQNKTTLATDYFNNAATLFEQEGDTVSYAKALVNIAEIYLSQQSFDKAYSYLSKGYELVLSTNILPLIQHNTQKMYSYYKTIGNFEQALYYLELNNEWNDSIYSIQTASIIEELDIKYKTEKKETEISNLHSVSEYQQTIIKQRVFQRNIMALFSIIFFVAIIVVFLVLLKIRKQKKQLLLLDDVKNRLFALISHDLRGYSSVFQDTGMLIKHHLKKGNYELINEMCDSLQQSAVSKDIQLDNMLNWAKVQLNGYEFNPQKLCVADETEQILQEIKEHSLLKSNLINNTIPAEASINFDKGAYAIIIRNLLTNANKFTENGTITISYEENQQHKIIRVTDTGVGMGMETKTMLLEKKLVTSSMGTKGEKGSGVGLSLVEKILSLSGGSISVDSEIGKGTTFCVILHI
jgi:signal transduction histidine kinase